MTGLAGVAGGCQRVFRGRSGRLLWPAVAALALAGCGEKNEYVPPPPPTVTIAPVVEQPVTRYLDLTGNTASINTVDLNARVQGFLTAINYKDGALAKKGDVLFVIEQDQYKADVDQAKATLAAKQASQVQAEAEFNRQNQLAKQDFASQATLDQARAKRDGAIADVQNAQASLVLAQINLGYTEVRAPFDGVVTAHLQDIGALVGYGSPTKLATIVEVNPLYVWFSLSEQQVLRIKEGLAKDGLSLMQVSRNIGAGQIPVEIGLQTESGFPHKGHLDYVAPQVDPNLGTLTVRAIFDNADNSLLPGLFARVRLPLGKALPSVLVSETAIGVNQLGPYVLTVGADNVVSQTTVAQGQLQTDGLRVIETGLKAGDKIIVNGLQRAIPGSKVVTTVGTMPVVAPSEPPKAGAPAPKPAATPAATKN